MLTEYSKISKQKLPQYSNSIYMNLFNFQQFQIIPKYYHLNTTRILNQINKIFSISQLC